MCSDFGSPWSATAVQGGLFGFSSTVTKEYDAVQQTSFRLLLLPPAAAMWFLALTLLPSGPVQAEDPVQGSEIPADNASAGIPEPASPIPGSLVICGGGVLPEAIFTRFVELAGGDEARVIIITTASILADTSEVPARLEPWRKHKLVSLDVLHTRSREVANDPEFVKPLTQATGVWFWGGTQSWLVDTYGGTRSEEALHGILKRGGVIGGTSAGAAIMSPVMIRHGNPEPEVGRGFGFLPGTVVDQHFLKRNRKDRLLNVLSRHPGHVGLGIDENTALVVQGRSVSVIGDSLVQAWYPAAEDRPERLQVLSPGIEADLVALSRTAISRMQPPHPSAKPEVPEIASGTLVIAGGGAIPVEVSRRFIDAAGGPEAPLVVITTALGGDTPPADRSKWLEAAGAKNVRHLHARTRQEVEHPQVRELLSQAKGVWFTGGRQWRIIDAFLDTSVEKLLRGVLERGGVVGGTSAGATVLASYLVRGNPLGNKDMMAAGYDRGFGLLPGVAIDQHFSQRNRFADMSTLKQTYPQLIGLGIDEETALVARGHVIEVVGRNNVAVYDQKAPGESDRDYEHLCAGERYDFKAHSRIAGAEGAIVKAGAASLTDVSTVTNATATTTAGDVDAEKSLICP